MCLFLANWKKKCITDSSSPIIQQLWTLQKCSKANAKVKIWRCQWQKAGWLQTNLTATPSPSSFSVPQPPHLPHTHLRSLWTVCTCAPHRLITGYFFLCFSKNFCYLGPGRQGGIHTLFPANSESVPSQARAGIRGSSMENVFALRKVSSAIIEAIKPPRHVARSVCGHRRAPG